MSDVLEKYPDLTSRPVLIMNENGEMGITEDALVKALREKTGPPQVVRMHVFVLYGCVHIFSVCSRSLAFPTCALFLQENGKFHPMISCD